MSQDPDRIAVPTNGRGPHPLPDVVAGTGSSPGSPTEEEMSVAFTPRQLAIGFAIVASLILLVAGRAHRRRTRD